MEHIYVTLENLSRFLNNLKSTIVGKNDIVNDLTTSDASKVLSAEQGVALKALVDELEAALETVHVQSDLSVNDENDPAYVHGRTHWIGDPELVTIIEETTAEIDSWAETPEIEFIAGQVYLVNWNGTEYECTAWDDGGGYVYLGNGNIYGGEGKGEDVPFCFETGYVNVAEAGTYTFSVATTVRKYYPIDERFLPPVIGRPGTGENAEVFNDYSQNIASGDYSHAEGRDTVALGSYSHAEGGGNNTSINLTGDVGSTSYTVSSIYDISDIAIGDYITLRDAWAIVTGYDSSTQTITLDMTLNSDNAFNEQPVKWHNGGIASGSYSHSEGYETIASGDDSHAEGWQTTASEFASHAEGDDTYASGYASHAEGKGTTASGKYSHAEGHDTYASGKYSHAEGEDTYAVGNSSHAEGEDTYAVGNSSHAEGRDTVALGSYSHAEGYGQKYQFINLTGDAGSTSYTVSSDYYIPTIAIGDFITVGEAWSTVAGYDSSTTTITLESTLNADKAFNRQYASLYSSGIASGYYSHSEGYQTVASGDSSHAEGQGTIATDNAQHVQGRYNLQDIENKYAHIVGNGTEYTHSNAHTIDWEGNAWFAGKVYVGGTGQDDGAAVEVATLANSEEWVFTLEDGSTVTKKVVLG